MRELLARATGRYEYDGLGEEDRQEVLLREILTPRPLVSPHLTYSEETTEQLRTLDVVACSTRATAGVRSRTTSSR